MRVAASLILYMGIVTVRSSSSTPTHSSFHCFASVLTLTLVSVRGILPLKQKGAHRWPTVPQLFSQQPVTKSPLRPVMPWIRGGIRYRFLLFSSFIIYPRSQDQPRIYPSQRSEGPSSFRGSDDLTQTIQPAKGSSKACHHPQCRKTLVQMAVSFSKGRRT